MASRIAGVGSVTVSLRRSMTMDIFCFLKRGKTCSPQFSLLHLVRTGSLHDLYAVLIRMQHIALPEGSVWPAPGKKPRQNVHRAILVAIHDEFTIRTAIRAFPKGHCLQ